MESLDKVFENLIIYQKEKILSFGRSIIPFLTQDDLLQPNDYPELENHPIFRYEEGILEGLLTAQMAYFREMKEKVYDSES